MCFVPSTWEAGEVEEPGVSVTVVVYQIVTIDMVCFASSFDLRLPGGGQLADGTFTIESEHVSHFGIYVDMPDWSK